MTSISSFRYYRAWAAAASKLPFSPTHFYILFSLCQGAFCVIALALLLIIFLMKTFRPEGGPLFLLILLLQGGDHFLLLLFYFVDNAQRCQLTRLKHTQEEWKRHNKAYFKANIGERIKLCHFHYGGLKTSHCFQWEYKQENKKHDPNSKQMAFPFL